MGEERRAWTDFGEKILAQLPPQRHPGRPQRSGRNGFRGGHLPTRRIERRGGFPQSSKVQEERRN